MPLRAKIVDLVVLLVSRVQKPAKTGRGGGSQESAHGVSMSGKKGESFLTERPLTWDFCRGIQFLGRGIPWRRVSG